MSDFKIDSGIPIPEGFEDAATEPISTVEHSEWVPFKPHQYKCRNDQHNPMIGRCSKCGDVFPCPSGKCGHADCADPGLAGLDCVGNDTAIPDWIVPEVASAMKTCEAGVSHEETP